MGSPRDFSLTFSGAGTQTLSAPGRFVRVLAADVSGVTIICDSGPQLTRFVGQDIDNGAQFQRLVVSVTVASTVTLVVSDTRQASDAVSVNATVSATVTPAGTVTQPGDVNCPNGAATQLLAGNANGLAVIIRSGNGNTYADGTVRIGTTGVTAAQGIELDVGDSITLDTTAPVYAYNNSGAAVTLQVLPLAK